MSMTKNITNLCVGALGGKHGLGEPRLAYEIAIMKHMTLKRLIKRNIVKV